ncbi:MAG: hypothetical protein ACLFSL_03445, partial [Candidatus Woesearchaeota archaeon]
MAHILLTHFDDREASGDFPMSVANAYLKSYINANTDNEATCYTFFLHNKTDNLEFWLRETHYKKFALIDDDVLKQYLDAARNFDPYSYGGGKVRVSHYHKELGFLKVFIDEFSDLGGYNFIGFSCITEINVLLSVIAARIYKSMYDCKTIFGGAFFSKESKDFTNNPFVDYLVVGAGFKVINDILLGKVKKGMITDDGFGIHKKSIVDIVPDYSDQFEKGFTFPIMFQDGCDCRCAYCTWSKFDTGINYYGSPEETAELILNLKKKYNADRFHFFNNYLNINPEFTARFAKHLIR